MTWSLVVREFINPDVSRWIGSLPCVAMAWPICVNYKPRRWLMPARLSHRSNLRDYEPGFLHMDIRTCRGCLTRKQRRYLL